MRPVRGCRARQVSDQYNCPACGLVWDANDPEPPTCNNGRRVETPVFSLQHPVKPTKEKRQ